jgi:hypothetical protein
MAGSQPEPARLRVYRIQSHLIVFYKFPFIGFSEQFSQSNQQNGIPIRKSRSLCHFEIGMTNNRYEPCKEV